jgi:hypothetical protein
MCKGGACKGCILLTCSRRGDEAGSLTWSGASEMERKSFYLTNNRQWTDGKWVLPMKPDGREVDDIQEE